MTLRRPLALIDNRPSELPDGDAILGAVDWKTGFPNTSDSALDFNPATRTVSLSSVGASYDTYVKGQKRTISSTKTVVIANTTGEHYVYLNDSDVLVSTTTFDLALILTYRYVCSVWWRADLATDVHRGDERHEFMDPKSHTHWHRTIGATYVRDGGLAVTDMVVDGDGSLNTQAQIGVSNGSFEDEDITHSISGFTAPATIPIWYFDSTGPVRIAGDSFPVIQNGKGGWAGTRIAYQGPTGLLEAANNSYVLMHLYGVNDWRSTSRLVLRPGGNYNTRSAAQAAAATEINEILPLPVQEFIKLATFIVQASNSDTNTPKCHFVSTEDGADYIDWRQAANFGGSGIAPTVRQEVFNETPLPSVSIPAIGITEVPGYAGLRTLKVNV